MKKIQTVSPLFNPVQVGRAGEDIALQIEAAILDERILPGECLPSERELQAQFQTGRGVVREAIRALKEKGLVEIRKGAKGGTYVKKLEVTNASESLALFLKQNHIETAHLAEFRESVDRNITMLAVTRASREQKEILLAKTHQMHEMPEIEEGQEVTEEVMQAHLEHLGELDRELNILLAQMTGNPIFEWIMRAMQHGFSSSDYALYLDADFRRRTIANWQETARNIVKGELLQALSSVGAHYVLLRQCIASRDDGAQ